MSYPIHKGQEVPEESNLAREEQGSNDLHQNLLEKKEDKYKCQRIVTIFIFNFHLCFEYIFFINFFKIVTLFEYCYWEFTLERYEEVEFFPANDEESGYLSDFYSDLKCESNTYAVCPGLCDVASSLEDPANYFEYSINGKFIIAAIGYIILGIIYSKISIRQRQLTFAIVEGLSFLSLMVGVFLYFYINDFSRFGETGVDAAEDKPLAFRYRSGMYVNAAFISWIFISRAIVIYFFKDIDRRLNRQ